MEAGTLNGIGIVGLGAAIDFINTYGIDKIREQEMNLIEIFYKKIQKIQGIKIYHEKQLDLTKQTAICSINLEEYDSGSVSDELMERFQIQTRSGAHCAPLVHEHFGTIEQGMVRFSFGHETTMKEINLANKKVSPVAWVPTLYFAMGMPFVVLNMVLSLLYKDLGIGNAEITFWTGLIMLPWTLKFLWSPLLELYKTKKFFVVLTQVVSGVVFGLAAISLHLPDFFAISIALFAVVALSGATHDIAADGTYMGVLSKEDQARWIGWQGAFYNIAKIFATGLLVWIAGIITPMVGVLNAWTAILVFLCVVMTALGIYHYFILPTDGKHNDDKKMCSRSLSRRHTSSTTSSSSSSIASPRDL